jgi:hypothetical protein
LIVQVAASVVRGLAHRDATAVKETQGAQPGAVAQVAADVLWAEDRLAQDAKKVVALWQALLQAAVVASQGVQELQTGQEQLVQQVSPRPVRLGQPMAAAVPLALQPAQPEPAMPQQALQEQV